MGEWYTSRPARFTPGQDNRYPLYRRLGGPQDRPGRVRKISTPPGLDLRTVQPVASRYADWAIAAHGWQYNMYNNSQRIKSFTPFKEA